MKKIVTFGGGNGTALVLRALKQHSDIFDIRSVVSMSDSGGSSGILRQEFHTLPPGDIMRAVIALSHVGYKAVLKELFYKHRFKGLGKLDGHNLGNLFLVLAAQYCGDFVSAIRALEQAVGAVGTVYPATLDVTDIIVRLDNDALVKTEAAIDRPVYDRSRRIVHARLEPQAAGYPEALHAIRQANHIILGPGSLYTSVITSILPQGIKEAIADSSADITFVAGNVYEKNGETGPTVLSECVRELEGYLPRPVNTIIFNNVELTTQQKDRYEERKWGELIYDPKNLTSYILISKPFERGETGLDPAPLSDIFFTLFHG